MLPNYDVDDFVQMFQGLKPYGAVWPRDLDIVNYQVDAALMPTYVRSWQSITGLIVDAFPKTTLHLLPEWEASLGLPDPCLGPTASIAQRQQRVVVALTMLGGQSAAYMIAVAAALGYSITITTFKPAVYGDSYGRDYAGTPWAYTWRVTVAALVRAYATYGSSYYGDYYSSWGSYVLECVLNNIKPAHTILQFAYTGSSSAAPLGAFLLSKNTLA